MEQEVKNEALLRKYLLGELNEAEEQVFEEQLLEDDELSELLLAEEDELVDAYLGGELSESERERFDSYFMVTPERRKKLKFAQALRRRKRVVPTPVTEDSVQNQGSNQSKEYQPTTIDSEEHSERELKSILPSAGFQPPSPVVVEGPRSLWNRALSTPSLRIAATVVIALGLIVTWRGFFYQSDIDKGLAALAQAYNSERPTEARISGLNYAPYPNTRGAGDGKVDTTSRNLAEITLLNEVAKNPSPAAHHALGRVYLAKREYKLAIEQFEAALKGDPNNAQLHSDYGVALLEMGRAENDKGKSFELSTRALEEFHRALEHNPSLLEAIFNRALCYSVIALPEKAKDDWLQYIEKDPNSAWADEARRRLKEVEDKKHKTSSAREFLFEAFVKAYEVRDDASAWRALSQARFRSVNTITERLLDSFLDLAAKGRNAEAQSYLKIASYAAELENQETADLYPRDLTRFYEKALPAQHRILSQARRLMKTARERQNQNEYEQAAQSYSKAKAMFEQAGDTSEAMVAQHLIGSSKLRIEPRESIRLLEPLSSAFRSREYWYLLSQVLTGIADAQSSMRNVDASLDASRQASELSQRIEDLNGALRTWQIPLAMFIRVGDYRRSFEWVARAFDLTSRFSPDTLELWVFYHQSAISLYSIELPKAALDFQQEAARLATESGQALYKSRSYARLGMIYEKLQEHDEAMKNAQLALQEGQNVKGSKIRANIVANSALHLADLYLQREDFQQAVANYNQAIEIHARLNIEGYILAAHRGRLLALMKMNDETVLEAALKEALPLIEQYRPKISEERNRNSFFELAQSVYDIAIDISHSRMNNDRQAFDYAEASRARSLLDMMKSSERVISIDNNPELRLPATSLPRLLDRIQGRLPAKVKVLQYCVLDDKILIWVVSNGPLETQERQVAADTLDQKVRQYVDLLRSESGENHQEAEDLGKELYDVLIGPVKSFLNDVAYLCIVPDRALNYLPFGALLSKSGRYFVEEQVFVLAPSCNIFLACTDFARSKQELRDEQLLGIGNPDFDRSKFANLPAAEKEIEGIGLLYNNPVKLIGPDARENRVKREMKRADVVHFATHFMTDPESPLSSKLLLSRETEPSGNQLEDGFLQSSEIYDMRLTRTRLVVLSACQTAIERSYRGEGAIGAARPFIRAGVPIVVASLWPVDANLPSDLMHRFHELRKRNLSTAEALCRAQRDMIARTDGRKESAYHWAAFAAIGGYATF